MKDFQHRYQHGDLHKKDIEFLLTEINKRHLLLSEAAKMIQELEPNEKATELLGKIRRVL